MPYLKKVSTLQLPELMHVHTLITHYCTELHCIIPTRFVFRDVNATRLDYFKFRDLYQSHFQKAKVSSPCLANIHLNENILVKYILLNQLDLYVCKFLKRTFFLALELEYKSFTKR